MAWPRNSLIQQRLLAQTQRRPRWIEKEKKTGGGEKRKHLIYSICTSRAERTGKWKSLKEKLGPLFLPVSGISTQIKQIWFCCFSSPLRFFFTKSNFPLFPCRPGEWHAGIGPSGAARLWAPRADKVLLTCSEIQPNLTKHKRGKDVFAFLPQHRHLHTITWSSAGYSRWRFKKHWDFSDFYLKPCLPMWSQTIPVFARFTVITSYWHAAFTALAPESS